ncbi:MAG: homoserine kinase [Clostridiaceae bacterium]|nr:homoserine kinase [Clostridiaceae bacterium]
MKHIFKNETSILNNCYNKDIIQRGFTMQELTVRVPGTSANLGPGFDCLGIAFQIYNWFTFRWQKIEDVVSPQEQIDQLAITNVRQLPMMEAYVKYCTLFDVDLPLLELVDSLESDVPVARGLGSSATCYTAGAKAAQWVAEQLYDKQTILKEIEGRFGSYKIDPFSNEAILAIAAMIEGHPDNISPAVFGGLQIASILEQKDFPHVLYQTLPVHSTVNFIISYPNYSLKTKNARAILPKKIDRQDAIFNLTALSFLIQGMETGDPVLLEHGLQDRLHQPYRAKLIDGFYDILKIGKNAGAVGSVLSGAGPAILTIYLDSENGDLIQEKIQNELGENWQVLKLKIDHSGINIKTGREKF